MKKILLILLITITVISCNSKNDVIISNMEQIDKIAFDYVIIALKLGEFDENYVDAYFGPDSLKQIANSSNIQLDSIIRKSSQILTQLNKIQTNDEDELFRKSFIIAEVSALKARAEYVSGVKFSFDEESQVLYGVTPPHTDTLELNIVLSSLDSLLPKSKAPISERYNNFVKQFIIPADKVDTVFKTAIAEARQRTLQHIGLPENESFVVESVVDKPWGAYNWFKGNSHSLIQVNKDLPIYIVRAIDLACHEGYPGHHVFHSLTENNFVKNKEWVEFTVYPLFSPMSLLSEGSANAGISICFPKEERLKFEKEILFPLANLDTTNMELYYNVLELTAKLNFATIEAARNYLDGNWTEEQTINYLVKYKLNTAEHAKHSLSFYSTYRSYVINYSLGQDIVEEYISKISKGNSSNAKQWIEFDKLIRKPVTGKEMQEIE